MSILFKRRSLIAFVAQFAFTKPYTHIKTVSTLTQKLPQVNILTVHQPNLQIYRNKGKGSKKKEKAAESDEEESDSNSPDFDSLIVDKNTKLFNTYVNSLRADVILKSGLSMARSKVEEMFYASKIRVNGKKIFKKSDLVQEGDEVDIIKGVSMNNPKFLTVARVEILEVKPKNEGYNLRLRRCKNLTVDNYEDTWKPSE